MTEQERQHAYELGRRAGLNDEPPAHYTALLPPDQQKAFYEGYYAGFQEAHGK